MVPFGLLSQHLTVGVLRGHFSRVSLITLDEVLLLLAELLLEVDQLRGSHVHKAALSLKFRLEVHFITLKLAVLLLKTANLSLKLLVTLHGTVIHLRDSLLGQNLVNRYLTALVFEVRYLLCCLLKLSLKRGDLKELLFDMLFMGLLDVSVPSADTLVGKHISWCIFLGRHLHIAWDLSSTDS